MVSCFKALCLPCVRRYVYLGETFEASRHWNCISLQLVAGELMHSETTHSRVPRGQASWLGPNLLNGFGAKLLAKPSRAGELHPGALHKMEQFCAPLCYPELAACGAQTLCVLGCEVGGLWNADAEQLLRRLVALRAHRTPPAVRAPAKAPWARRW